MKGISKDTVFLFRAGQRRAIGHKIEIPQKLRFRIDHYNRLFIEIAIQRREKHVGIFFDVFNFHSVLTFGIQNFVQKYKKQPNFLTEQIR
jgi:hypothetical protein